ncbi:unnamed protein product [marine sediment metagenome]|uniref:ArnR1-like winged helix-turn-helix domain-containing protein n=1 Tax=marine sediment metagenome TaxID=412755 RepID=X1UXC5_9ZZZZ
MRKATKLELLQFIYEREVVSRFDVVEKFGYTPGGADSMLAWLKREKLVTNDRKGEWTISDDGLRRLIYYGRL